MEVVARFPVTAELAFVPAFLDVAIQLDADLVRVQPIGAHGHRAGMMIGVIDDFAVGQTEVGHDG